MSDSNPSPPGGKSPKIQFQMDEATALGRYSNLVLINHTDNEFVVDFAFMQPGSPRAKVVSRIITSPRHTKRIIRALQSNLEKYEARFGELDAGDADEPSFH